MRFTFMTQRFERLTKFGLQFGWRIAHHREPTAAGWPVLGKRGYDHQTARPDRAKHLLHIGSPILDTGQEMEHRAIVPDIVGVLWQFGAQDIGFQPLHPFGHRTQS